jgi:cell wall-associated NlpC family hydrolase
VASHRRPAQHRRVKPRTAPRGAAILATAAATATGVIALAGPSNADPAPTAAQVQEKADTLQKEANATQTRVAEEQAAMNLLREQIGAIAAEQYRTGGLPPELQLALSGDPAQYLQKAQMLDQLDSQQASRLEQIAAQARMLQQDRAEASAQLAELDELRKNLGTQKTEIQAKLNKAQTQLNTLSAAERQAILDSNDHATNNDRASRDEPREEVQLPDVPASERAAKAIAFARAQIGKPYGWGKAGPSSFDCSGLTQQAWAAANVKLPRTTWDQVKVGTRVSKSQLQPGDLIFFYSDNSHVGLYIGGGQMIHAPRPGSTIRVAPINEMPFYAATRPA